MGNSILHILVIWSKGLYYKEEILSDLRKSFDILKVFHCHWDKDKFLQNYMVFYAHSQYHLDSDAFRSLLQNKVNHCGDDDFTVVVLRDDNPLFENRSTSSGVRLVNTRIFDKKIHYRALTGGGHKIHSSDDAWETNHDLTLMFGLNTEDFCRRYNLDGGEANISQNCQGVGGYNSIQDFFYVLNNTIKYCVLRNHECLPDEYTVEGHGDIDLLVENKNYMAYVTLAEPVFEEPYRVYHLIKIGGKEIPFDFRFVGDNYYDKPWEEHILNNRSLTKGLFYVPNDEDQFYSLLYHAYIQKYEVKSDYPPKLLQYAEKLDLTFQEDRKIAISLLDSFMQSNHYEYIKPNDLSVVYNIENLKMSSYALRHGYFIKRVNETGGNGFIYDSLVYEKEDSFVKKGTPWLINNEKGFLERLHGDKHFPLLIKYNISEEEAFMEISRIEGFDANKFFGNANNHTRAFLKSFVKDTLSILEILEQKGICHRDFIPSNLIVSKHGSECNVGLIDFGWAVDTSADGFPEPKFLGGRYRSPKGYSDLYSFGALLMEYWYDVPYIRRIASALQLHECINDGHQKETLEKVKCYFRYPFTPYDEMRLFLRRHQRIHIIKASIIKKIRIWKKKYHLNIMS